MPNESKDPDVIYVPLSGTRAQSIHRLQIGLSGLAAMALLVGLATVIMDRARQTEAAAVPESVSTAAAEPTPAANDPLADAGVAPDVAAPAKPGPAATATAKPIAPAQEP